MVKTDRIQRLVKIILLVQRGGTTVSEMSKEFGIAERTVYRDMKTLEDAEVGIYFDHQKKCYCFREESLLNYVSITQEEALSLLYCMQAFSYRGNPVYDELKTAQQKLLTFLSPRYREMVSKIGEGVRTSVHNPPANRQIFWQIQEAIRQLRCITIKYDSIYENRKTGRDLDPLFIIFSNNAWYLYAFCHMRQDYRTFRMDRIQKVWTLSDQFVLPKNFLSEKFIADSMNQIEGEVITVVLRFSIQAAYWVCDKRLHDTQTEEVLPDGRLKVTLHVPGNWELKRMILSYGSDVEVLEPDTLRKEIKRTVVATAKKYN